MFSVKFLKDAAERVVWTFAQALLGAGVVLDGGFFGGDNIKVAGAAAVASLLKAIVATRVGDSDSAASIPATS